MGGGTYDPGAYRAYSSSTVGKSTDDIFATRVREAEGIKKELNPHGVVVREARDSTDHPASTPLIVALDVTGSMGMIADALAREKIGVLFTEVLDRKPITDPQVMFMGIGDVVAGDRAPLQVSQFESDNRVVEQLTGLWIEKRGGGNNFESYNLPWYFAAMHTSIDCFEKRGRKGYLFTVGDEEVPRDLEASDIQKVCGDDVQRGYTNAELLEAAGRMYHLFHIMVAEGSHARTYPARVRDGWTNLLGQRALWLDDHTKLAEVIVSAIQITEGVDATKVAKSWSGETAIVVANATRSLTPAGATPGGVVRF